MNTDYCMSPNHKAGIPQRCKMKVRLPHYLELWTGETHGVDLGPVPEGLMRYSTGVGDKMWVSANSYRRIQVSYCIYKSRPRTKTVFTTSLFALRKVNECYP